MRPPPRQRTAHRQYLTAKRRTNPTWEGQQTKVLRSVFIATFYFLIFHVYILTFNRMLAHVAGLAQVWRSMLALFSIPSAFRSDIGHLRPNTYVRFCDAFSAMVTSDDVPAA